MFGIDPKAIQQVVAKIDKISEDQRKLATEVESLNTLLPQMITELKRLNGNLEKK